MRLVLTATIFAAAFTVFSCSGSDRDVPDISGIKADLEFHRFDRDFFAVDTNQLEQSLGALEKKYPNFLPLYFEYFSPIDFIVSQQEQSRPEAVREYIRNIKPLFDSANQEFTNLEKTQKQLEKNLKYVKSYFPSFNIPVVLTSVESLNPENPLEIYGTTYYHDTLIISLQMFLGKNFSVYDPAQYPDYLRRRFEPEYMVPNCLRAVAMDLYPDNTETALIDQMVEKGKQWYLQKKFLPDTPDSLITGFNTGQMKWCVENEGNIWSFLNQRENLYANDQPTIQTYLGEAPFTSTLPHGNNGEGAPGNIGAWIGWRIVEAYVAQQKNVDLKELLQTPARKIFEEAKYRPK